MEKKKKQAKNKNLEHHKKNINDEDEKGKIV